MFRRHILALMIVFVAPFTASNGVAYGSPPPHTLTGTVVAIADGDIHPRPPGVGIGGVSKALYPYMTKQWREHVEAFGITYRQPWEKGSAYPKGQPQAARRDAWTPNGGSPGSDLAFMQKQHLDPNALDFGKEQYASGNMIRKEIKIKETSSKDNIFVR